ncbi:MAG: response regulator [Oscillochloris sp.]|nr:response regulator [Oscillochloris sp.]
MDNRYTQLLLAELGSVMLMIDRDLLVQNVAGSPAILDHPAPIIGCKLLELLPELIGNETALSAIMAGRRERLLLPAINRDAPDGTPRYLDLLTLPHIDPEGTIVGLLQIISDVSERGRIEQERVQQRNELQLLQAQMIRQNIELARANAQMKRATRQKDEFMSGMSHEVRTPLTSILGLSEMLSLQLVGPVSEEQVQMLRGIMQSGNHLLALINDMLDIAKIEAGQMQLTLDLVSLKAVCESAIQIINQQAMRKQMYCRLEFDPQVQVIRGDSRRLRQALINLLSNAVKFTPDGGEFGIRVSGDLQAEAVQICVWDSGIGIAEADLIRLFQPFSQIDNPLQASQIGSGLGLMLVAQLAALHGGSVRVESTPATGSRFTLVLPWLPPEQTMDSKPEPEMPAAVTGPPSPYSGAQLLLIDDDRTGSEMLRSYLECLGYQLISVESAEEGLAYLRDTLPNLIMMDIRLHGIDGLEAIRRLRADVATRSIPIIALTTLAMPGDDQRCLAAGANAYISKPLRLHRLATVIADLLTKSREVAS